MSGSPETPAAGRSLDGRRALVTGGATGIGRATVKRLAADGATVVITSIGAPEPAQRLEREVTREGGRAVAISGDVSTEDKVADMFARARAEGRSSRTTAPARAA